MLSKTPPMGFNTWNTYGLDICDKVVRETADAMVDLGLRDAGYEYLVIDDGWSLHYRDPETHKIVADPEKFPNGMKDVADYVHSKGLKFGMYSCAGVRTCGNYPGSFDHEYLDAETFAEFGVDYLKYDYCFKPETANGRILYNRMGMALQATGREILFSACNWGEEDPGKWMRATGAHMYRSTYDIVDNFESIKNIAVSQFDNFCYSAPGCFNDLDMLVVGMNGEGFVGKGGCTNVDYRTHFALWCMFNSPLMIGNDIRKVSDEALAILKDKELIRINQDPECRPAYKVGGHPWDKEKRVFAKHLSNNEYAFGFFNLSESDGVIPLYAFDAGLVSGCGYAFDMVDIETGEHVGLFDDFFEVNVPMHACKIYRAKLIKR